MQTKNKKRTEPHIVQQNKQQQEKNDKPEPKMKPK
jgi:hypothetical protein